MKIAEPPKVGWGILEPDPELTEETLKLLEQMDSLSRGQRDALLTRAVPRYLAVEEELELGQEPDGGAMVCTSTSLSNFWYDILGKP